MRSIPSCTRRLKTRINGWHSKRRQPLQGGRRVEPAKLPLTHSKTTWLIQPVLGAKPPAKPPWLCRWFCDNPCCHVVLLRVYGQHGRRAFRMREGLPSWLGRSPPLLLPRYQPVCCLCQRIPLHLYACPALCYNNRYLWANAHGASSRAGRRGGKRGRERAWMAQANIKTRHLGCWIGS